VSVAQRAATLACALLAGLPAQACELVLNEHRSGLELRRLPLDPAAPQVQIAFEHSVLGTTVIDRYAFDPQARLVEERFDGQGYGLPHAAGPGEQLQRDGPGWRLTLNRSVQPLVVRPLPAQHMRLLLPGSEPLPLSALSAHAVQLVAQGCGAAQALAVPARPAP
jgi:hypothetical protein